MRGLSKRLGIEAMWLLAGCAVGVWIWMHPYAATVAIRLLLIAARRLRALPT